MTEEISKEKVQRMNQLIKNSVIEMEQKPERDHDFLFVEEPNQKQESVMSKHLKRRIKPYTSRRIKTRNVVLRAKILWITTLLLIRFHWNERLWTLKIAILYTCFGMSA